MPFVLSLAMSLLALTAGLFLLIKARQDAGRFLKIMSWIIIGSGMLAVLFSLHLPLMRHFMKHHDDDDEGFSKGNYFYCKDKLPFQKFMKFGDFDEDMPFGNDEKQEVKVIVKKGGDDNAVDPADQAEKIVKILSSNLKLTTEQETKIKDEIEKSLSADLENSTDKKEEAKDTK